MKIQANQIANLLAIARAGSFTRAAEIKGMSQPALTNSIAMLEKQIGVRVLERSRRGSVLTSYGEILVRRAEGLQTLLEDAETEVRRSAAGIGGPLRIGATPSVLTRLVPHALSALVNEAGPIDIEIVEGLDETLIPVLRSGGIDIVVGPVGEMFSKRPDIRDVALVDDPFVLAVGQDSPYRGAAELHLDALRNEPWILPRVGSSYRMHVEALFRNNRVDWPEDCILSNSVALVEMVVRTTRRLTIVSPIQLSPASGLETIPLTGSGVGRSIGYRVRAAHRLPEIGEQFLRHLHLQTEN